MSNPIRATPILQGILVLGVCVVGLFGGLKLLSDSYKDQSASSGPVPTAQGAKLPPLDTNTPAKTETATFALG